MRQFLLLNERIEDLKWQHKMRSYKDSNDSWQTTASSLATSDSIEPLTSLNSSRCLQAVPSASAQRFGSEYLHMKYPSPSQLSLIQSCSSSITDTLNPGSDPDLRLHDLHDVTSDFDSDVEETCLTPRATDVTDSDDPLKTPTGDAPHSILASSASHTSKRVTSSFVWEPLTTGEQVRVKKSSTMTSTASNESASTVDSGIDADVSYVRTPFKT